MISDKTKALVKLPLIVTLGLCGAVWLHLFSRCIAMELVRPDPQSGA